MRNIINSVFEDKKVYKLHKHRFKQSQNTQDFDLSRQVIHYCKKAIDDINEKYKDNYKQNEYYQKYSELMWLTEQYLKTNNESIYFQKTTSENIIPKNLKHLYPSCKNFFSAVNKLSNYIDLEDLDIFQKSLLWKTDKTYQANEKKENPINRTVPLIGTYHGQLKNWLEPDELKPFSEILKDYQIHLFNWFYLQLNERKNKGINIEAPEYNFLQEHLKNLEPPQNENLNAKKTLLDFIENVNDKEVFMQDLKNTFNTEKGKSIKAILNKLEEAKIITIAPREFMQFYKELKTYFGRNIGTYPSINDPKEIEKEITDSIYSKLNPLITKHKTT